MKTVKNTICVEIGNLVKFEFHNGPEIRNIEKS